MPEDQSEPTTYSPFTKKESRSVEASAPEGEPRTISPFMRIDRGEDTIDPETDALIFADFSPVVLPADTPDEIVVVIPKDVSAPGPAPSSESQQTTEQTRSDSTAPTPAATGDGTPKTVESLKPDSSTDQKSGQSEPPV